MSFWNNLQFNNLTKKMPCFRAKEKPIPPLCYVWSASFLIPPNNQIKIDHRCNQPVVKKNYIKINKELLVELQKKVAERNKPVVNKCSLAKSYKQSNARTNKSSGNTQQCPTDFTDNQCQLSCL